MNTKEEIDILVEENIKLVNYMIKKRYSLVLKKIQYLGLYEDFYQEGCVGLLKAAKAFDKDKGIKFSTFACYWINFHLMHFASKYLSRHYKDNLISANISINKDGEDGILLIDTIATYDKYSTDIEELKIFAKTSKIKNISKIIDMSLRGFTQRQIGNVLGISQVEVSRKIKCLKEEYEIYESLGSLIRINKVS